MCPLCGKIIKTKEELYHWVENSSYECDMPRNVIFKDIINHYLYSSVGDHCYNEETRMLINYCPVCGREL